jgi:outer membrane receptor protein involved in Fe transport
LLAITALIPATVLAEPVEFNLPAQPADGALMAFCKQANVELIFSFDELHRTTSTAVEGSYEPEEALSRLLRGTGYSAVRNGKGRFAVVHAEKKGAITGRLLTPEGTAAQGARVFITGTRLSTVADESGSFEFPSVPEGSYSLVATATGLQPLEIADARVANGRTLALEAFTMQAVSIPATLEPFVVEAKSVRSGLFGGGEAPPMPRTAIGDLDQARSENDALDYSIFNRDQISRSGVVNLNEFLQQEILDSVATLPPEQNGSVSSFASGSSNLNLRGYGAEETIILVDGRRLPEIVTALPASLTAGPAPPQSDVNVIPLSLIERVEVLPVSASAIYSGSPIGGVINIVLRPDVNATELTTTYTNALAGFNAPQATVSLLHGETLLGGRLHIRLNATYTQVAPPTEADLGYIRENLEAHPETQSELYRATPNVSSTDLSPLFGPGSSSFTSVAPGSDGTGGLAAFGGRDGVQELALYQPPGGGLADSTNSLDYPFGRRERTASLYGSVIYDVFPWLQVGVDATASRTINNTGYSVFNGNLDLPAASPLNPFQQDVSVTLNESAPLLGEDYNEAHIDYYSAVLGLLLRMPADWQASFDAQYGLSVTRYRGIEGVDDTRWQQLVDSGAYNPLRDTQVLGPPQAFYDQALIFYGSEGSFVTLGDYDTFDSSLRLSNASLHVPTGTASVTVGGDYRYARLASYVDVLRYGDGSLVAPPDTWVGRSLQRVSVFGEIKAPLLPDRWLPTWIKGVETDLAVRYTASDIANEANYAPTGAIKIDLPAGFSLRATYATSNTFPPPDFSRLAAEAGISTSGSGVVEATTVVDPLRGQEQETVQASDAANPNLVPEAAVTQTAGFIYQHGTVHQFRASVDFVDTVTSGQEVYLDPQQVVDLEGSFPQRVIRAPASPGDPFGVGPITSVLTGNFNLAWRHSYEWSTSLDYTWSKCLGGSLEAYCRWIYFKRYDVEGLPTSPPVDELRAPDGLVPGLLPQRMNFGSGWSSRAFGFGMDGHYYSAQVLPQDEQAVQGSDSIDPYWQFDAYLQGDLGRWIPWKSSHYRLKGQLRVDNVFDASPPKYAVDPTGVQTYTDWRGRVYSLSVTVTF